MLTFAKDFAKDWVEYPFNPTALASIAIAKESIFCNAIANAQCERNLKDKHERKVSLLLRHGVNGP